ncbi:hypothetical protein [Amycolatopsis sp. NBC_01480]|uniref:hypothetical protein n=1 Tax=Amycolatopsis sp. NBC_01480 TaxID=2903562 RepID=UPI002E2AAA1C|nr:hypothetical protein [Amycolatopsis sp. NBC_01480]
MKESTSASRSSIPGAVDQRRSAQPTGAGQDCGGFIQDMTFFAKPAMARASSSGIDGISDRLATS